VPPLDIKLETMLNQMADAFSRDANIALRLSLANENQRLSAGKRIALAHLAQEALRNVQQHAHAHAAWLALQYESSMVILTVQDDGVGLLDGTYHRPGLHALRMIRYRLAEFDGQLEVFEGEQGGVTVRGTLPLSNN
jgi:signal transduction histidine kinase